LPGWWEGVNETVINALQLSTNPEVVIDEIQYAGGDGNALNIKVTNPIKSESKWFKLTIDAL